jgi:uncharacterized ferritin-like protein (DUF455 family)
VTEVPSSDTIEAWAERYIATTDLEHKLNPPVPPKVWKVQPQPLRLAAPGRPAELLRTTGRLRPPRSLESARARAKLLHTFFHHELQAAELMCWALLAFPNTEAAFRRGLLKICLDEVRHMSLYRTHIESLGFALGDFPIRDWFWQRVPNCQRPVQFVAMMGMGLEAANLEHAADFARRFSECGDSEGARIQQRVAAEEIPHVKFGVKWFRHFQLAAEQATTFQSWCDELPPPLSPLMMRGSPLNRAAREKAGMDAAFLSELERWTPAPEQMKQHR